MRTLKFLLIKEFKQIFRDKTLLRMIFVMPFMQLLVMPLAADYEIKNINIAIVNSDHSTFSQQLTDKILASGYFRLAAAPTAMPQAIQLIEAEKADLVLEIPYHFQQDLARQGAAKVYIAINAINGTKAGLGGTYLNAIVTNFNQQIQTATLLQTDPREGFKQIELHSQNWYNPYLNYKLFMVPAILVILVTMVGAYMCSLNIVREKEVGTIEQINVSPIKKHIYILGKLIPFLIIGIVVFTIGFFIIAWGLYGIVPVGNLALLYAYLILFLTAILGFGLLVSTYADTQQQAMSVAFFFMMIFILMSGLFTSIDAMPKWAQTIAYANPVTYFIQVMRMIVLKGSGFGDITSHIVIMIGFALLLNTWAILNYRKTA